MTCASSHKPFFFALTRIVNGAIKNTLDQHPEYLRHPEKAAAVRVSMTKRIVGQLLVAGIRPKEGTHMETH